MAMKNRKLTGRERMNASLEHYRDMTPEELFAKYRIVTYSQTDIGVINRALEKIQGVLEKYNKRLRQ